MDDKQLALTEEQPITKESRQELAKFYDNLDRETKEFIQAEEQDIVITRAYADVVTGQKLARIKARLPHGQWGDYLRLRWNESERTAQSLIKIAESYKSARVADLTNYDRHALTLLAYAPESARQEAQDLHDSGEHISAACVEIIQGRVSDTPPFHPIPSNVFSQISPPHQKKLSKADFPWLLMILLI